MAYTNPLSSLTPAPGDQLSEGATRIREVKAALIERLLTVFTNVDLDPLVFKTGLSLPGLALSDDLDIGSGKFTVDSATGNAHSGGTLDVDGAVTINGAATIDGALTVAAAIKAAYVSARVIVNATTGNPLLEFEKAGAMVAGIAAGAANEIDFMKADNTSMGNLTNGVLTVASVASTLTGNVTGNVSGAAGSAARWTTPVVMNGISVDGATTPITLPTVTADADTGTKGVVKIDYTQANPVVQLANTIRRITVAADGAAVLGVDTTIGTFAAVPVGTYIARARVRLKSGVGYVGGAAIKLIGSTPANLTNAVSNVICSSSTTASAAAVFEGDNRSVNVCHIDSSAGSASAVIEWYFTVATAAIDIAWTYAAQSGTAGETQQILKGSYIELIRAA